MTEIKIYKEPEIYSIGRQHVDQSSLMSYFLSNGYDVMGEGKPLDRLLSKDPTDASALCEIAGRKCYNSWEKGRESADYFEHIKEVGHGSILTHGYMTFLIQGVSRSLTMESNRHHVGVGISQESQRFVNYENPAMVMHPSLQLLGKHTQLAIVESFNKALLEYQRRRRVLEPVLRDQGFKGVMLKKRVNEAARMCLPNEMATSLVWSANFRALRNVIADRGGMFADLEIRAFACKLLQICKQHVKDVFDDMEIVTDDSGFNYINPGHGKI